MFKQKILPLRLGNFHHSDSRNKEKIRKKIGYKKKVGGGCGERVTEWFAAFYS